MIVPRSPSPSPSPSLSPFRDELACVHEKLRHLEAENRELREQADRLPVRPRISFLVPLTTAWALLMTASLVRVADREPVQLVTTPIFHAPPRSCPVVSPRALPARPFDGPSLGF